MKEFFKALLQTISAFFCIASLLAICFFCCTAYAIPVDRMCKVYASSLNLVVLLFSMMLLLVFVADDAFWEHLCSKLNRNTEEEGKSQLNERDYKAAKIKCALYLLPVSIVITELTLYAISELGRFSISLETYLIGSAVIVLALFFGMMLRRDFISGEWNKASAEHKKPWLRYTAMALCVISAIVFVPRAYARISTYNSYWEGSPQTSFSFEYRVNDKDILTVRNVDGYSAESYISYLDQIPETVLTKLVEDGWTICIDSNHLAEFSWQSNGKRRGPLYYSMTDYPNKTIIASFEYPMVQEIGRFCYNEISDKETAEQLFSAEARKLADNGSGLEIPEGYLESAESYLIFCFTKYVTAQNDNNAMVQLAQAIPLTFDYIVENIAAKGNTQ